MAKYEIKEGVGIIPGGTVKIASGAFYESYELRSVVIPDSVTEIGSAAFYGCSELREITIPARRDGRKAVSLPLMTVKKKSQCFSIIVNLCLSALFGGL